MALGFLRGFGARAEAAAPVPIEPVLELPALPASDLAPLDVRAENATTTNLTADELVKILGLSATSSSGQPVTPDTAMRVATVYACVNLVAGAIATLPLGIYERVGNDRQKASHEYWWLFNEQANEKMTSAAAWEYLLLAKLLHGDGIAKWLRPSVVSNRVIGWEPMHPLSVRAFKSDGRVYYRHVKDDGTTEVLDSADVLHLPSLGFDGCSSPSPITYAAREAIGTALAGDQYTGKFFNGGAAFDFALKTASKLDKPQLDVLHESLKVRLGTGNRTPLILSGGLEPAQLSVNSKDAEILSTRMFTVEEICRIFGVPPHMVGHTEKTTSWGTGIEQQGIGFVRYTLQRHLTPLAQEINRKLWPSRSRYFVEHIAAALERGDLKARYEAYRIALGRAGEMPWMDADEIRRLENLAPNPDLKRNDGAANAQPTDPAAR